MKMRFRASIYLDVDIPYDLDEFQLVSFEEMKERLRGRAIEEVQEVVKQIFKLPRDIAPNVAEPYVGGVAIYTPENLLNPLDREI